jgi:hypothetical protein
MKGVANHISPESCAGAREGLGEALTGGNAGQPLSRERHYLRSADVVETDGRLHLMRHQRETQEGSARSETLACMDASRSGTGRSHRYLRQGGRRSHREILRDGRR